MYKFAFTPKLCVTLILTVPCFNSQVRAIEEHDPILFADQPIFDHDSPESLGLSKPIGLQTSIVYHASQGNNRYNHGAVPAVYMDRIYVQWQSSLRDEDADDTIVCYSTSSDGNTWSPPRILAKSRPDTIVTNGGWHVAADTLVAYLNEWPTDLSPRGGYTSFIKSTDGNSWSDPTPVTDTNGQPISGIIEQDVRSLATGRLLTAVHEQPGLHVQPYYTDDASGTSGWTRGEMPRLESLGKSSRALEPSWFRKRNGTITMTFRDQKSSYKVLASQSSDEGLTWTKPELTNFPDSRSKQSTGNLPDGTAFIVNNPSGSKTRIPLVITTSEDGIYFDKAFLIAGEEELPPMEYAGKYKREGYSYPKSYVTDEFVYISYAVNKEDVAISFIPVNSLVRSK